MTHTLVVRFAEITLKGLKNGQPMKDYALGASDRSLRFVDCTVRAWNFYPAEKAHLTIEDCTFGEALAFGEGRIEIRNSENLGACIHPIHAIMTWPCSLVRLAERNVNFLNGGQLDTRRPQPVIRSSESVD